MNSFPWLTVLVAVPLVGAVATALFPADGDKTRPKQVALVFSLLALVPGVVMAVQYDPGAGFQFNENHSWIPLFGAHYSLGVDGLGLLMVLLTLVLVPIVIGASWYDADADAGQTLRDGSLRDGSLRDGSSLASSGQASLASSGQAKSFFAWALGLEATALAVFSATDLFLFYVVFEATLIPAYFLIGGFGREGRRRAAVKFLIYQLGGGLVMLASVIGFYAVSAGAGTPSYLLGDLANLSIDPTTQKWLFVGLFIAFAVKAPMFPVHTWLADTTEQATTGTSVLLVCVLDKIGTFGMLRYCLGLLPDASRWATPTVIILALISIVYGALVAIGQDDMLRLIGLTSLSHFGLIVLGIFVLTSQGGSGAILYMVNHGLATAALFLTVGFMVKRRGSASISAMGGLEKATPVLAGLFMVFCLAALGLPGLSTFVSEILVLISAFQHAWWTGAIAVTVIVLAAFYALWMYQRTMTGPGHEIDAAAGAGTMPDLDRREVGTLAPLFLGLVLFGFFPMPLLNVVNPYVETTLHHVGVTDPAPKVASAQSDGGQQ